LENFADDEEVETEVRKWLRQQSKDFYAAGLDALVKLWDKCITVGGGNVLSKLKYHMFYILFPFANYILILLNIFFRKFTIKSFLGYNFQRPVLL
jgi:hypothetical protein